MSESNISRVSELLDKKQVVVSSVRVIPRRTATSMGLNALHKLYTQSRQGVMTIVTGVNR